MEPQKRIALLEEIVELQMEEIASQREISSRLMAIIKHIWQGQLECTN